MACVVRLHSGRNPLGFGRALRLAVACRRSLPREQGIATSVDGLAGSGGGATDPAWEEKNYRPARGGSVRCANPSSQVLSDKSRETLYFESDYCLG